MRLQFRSAPRRGVLAALAVALCALLFLPAAASSAPQAPAAPQPFGGAAGVRLGAEPIVDPAGPPVTVGAPSVSTSTSAKASFTVSWAAAPLLPSGGFDAYRVEYREPGVSYWLVWKPATTARSATFTAQAGHAYQFRAAATKTADPSVVGPWSVVRSVAVPVDDASFAVTKTWARTTASGAYLAKIRSATSKGATAAYRFKGTQIALIAPRGRAYGKVGVYTRYLTSGGTWSAYKLVKTVDLYSSTTRARVATTIASYSSSAVERQVKLVVTGTKNARSASAKVAFDGLAVYGRPHATGYYSVNMSPSSPQVVMTEQLQFTASIPGCADQRVEWAAYRVDRYGAWHTDGAGSISADGLYTAPALPSNTSAGAGDAYRYYVVTAIGVANPDQLYMSRSVTVTLGPSPVVTSVLPLSGPAGGTVLIMGRNFTDHGGVPEVLFQGVSATLSSYSDTSITAVVPGGWQTWSTSQQMYVWVRTWGQDSGGTLFTVTGIEPMPPSPWYLNDAGEDDNNAGVGDTLRIYGHGFAPTAADNRVRFGGGVQTTAVRYEADPYGQDLGTLFVTVPEGASSGPLAFQRLDGDGRWSSEDLVLEVKPPTVVTAGLHSSFNGFVTGPKLVSNGSWGNEEWLLQGTNFSKLRIFTYSATTPGIFWLDMRRNGVTKSRIMRAVSDTVAVPHRTWGEQHMFPDELFADALPGDTVELRIRGDELTNRYERTSAWVAAPLGERPVFGAVDYLKAASLVEWWGASHTVAKGSWLRIVPGDGAGTQALSAPGLWQGTLPMGADGIATKLVALTTPGAYTITNHTKGESVTLIVNDVGGFGTWSYGGSDYTQTEYPLLTSGLRMRFGGGEIVVPPGALSASDLGASSQFSLSVHHAESSAISWDPALTDGGRSFSLEINPQPTRLLKPITITVPYEATGRTTTPFLGLWDDASRLYYDYRLDAAQIDTAKRTLTMVLPAGQYTSAAGAPRLAAPSATTGRLGAPAGSGLPDVAFNSVFRKVGAVSAKVPTSGQGFVWKSPRNESWGIRVDAVTDPSTSSYVPPEKAQEVLDVAVATWENLTGKGWSEPEAMISITVRDYGDPGVYQGSTTKAVFGQPWVYINSRLTMGAKLDTAVSHEMAHVFQRQLTTNISTKWIDEAVAEWVAWDTLGTGSDLKASFEAGCDFPAAAFPSGFWAGYSAEQAYGAGAFIIWLADTYGPAAVLNLYDTLAYNPEYWYDAPATFQTATGHSVPQLVAEFATEFWLQTYDPIKQYTWSSRMIGLLPDYTGKTMALSMPADSSRGLVFAPTSAFTATLTGTPMVARAPGLPAGALIDVYVDSTGASAPPSAPVKIGTLSNLTPVVSLGAYAGGCYRMVAVTPAGAPLTTGVTVEAVRLLTMSPASVPKAGGTIVTLSGCGFGDQKNIVMVGPASVSGAAITTWTDTQIVFTMPNMGATTGVHAVSVMPLIGGTSNALNLTVY